MWRLVVLASMQLADTWAISEHKGMHLTLNQNAGVKAFG